MKYNRKNLRLTKVKSYTEGPATGQRAAAPKSAITASKYVVDKGAVSTSNVTKMILRGNLSGERTNSENVQLSQ